MCALLASRQTPNRVARAPAKRKSRSHDALCARLSVVLRARLVLPRHFARLAPAYPHWQGVVPPLRAYSLGSDLLIPLFFRVG
jgi:hypothetical protein